MTLKHVLVLILTINLLSTCQGGLLGAATGLAVCTSGCHAGYFTCLVAGGGGAVYATGGLALPGVVQACTTGEVACIGVCTTLFAVVSGPI